jgi:hypothetical protein
MHPMAHADDDLAWTRQPGESPRAYHWLAHYRDLWIAWTFQQPVVEPQIR